MCALGTTRTWPGLGWRRSMNAIARESFQTTLAGSFPATMAQNRHPWGIHTVSHGRALSSLAP